MSNNVIAAILGVIAAAITALILSPVVYIVFTAFFDLYVFTEPPKGAWIKDAIIIATVFLWILATSIAGGYICSKYCKKKEDFSVFLFIVFSFIILLLVYGLHFLDDWMMAIPIATFIIGACVGNLFWLRKKKKTINNSSSPAAPQ
jgi:uncharacterized membrane-anchored protein